MPVNSKAVAIFMVLAISMLVMILAAIGINFSLSNYTLTSRIIDGIKAFYFAEAGMQRAMYKIKNEANPNVNNYRWSFAGQTVNFSITVPDADNPDAYRVESDCTYGKSNTTRSITATVEKKGSILILSAWSS